ncbi:MAG: Fic family protein [bacterium]|nr:Fic family protein [bacterium]
MDEDIRAPTDNGEPVASFEPLLIGEGSRHRGELTDLAVELAARSAGVRNILPRSVRVALANLVRTVDYYYSNLIEGHVTHPVDIEHALGSDYGDDGRSVTVTSIREIHHRFCELLPDELLWSEDPATRERVKVVPGELRRSDVQVGRHVPVSGGAVPRFLAHMERTYSGLGKTDSILAAAAAHHRLLWVHPFLDGNGRVARMLSHAMLLGTLDTGGVWSVARGLARSEAAYKTHLANCDLPRRNDLDGRGVLSERELAGFTRYFLEVCIDQVSFMEALIQPDRLRTRILLWAEEEVRLSRLPARSAAILEAVLLRGELARGDVAGLLGTTARHARRVVAALTAGGVLASDVSRAPLRLVFPASLAPGWLPGLFPEPN